MSHVIAAVSTGNQISAIGILRLTGDGCAQAAAKVFTLNNGQPLWEAPNRKLMLGALHDKDRRVIDACMAVYTRGPHSYTGENTKVVLVAIRKQQLAQLKELVMDLDSGAFVIVQEAHQVLGDGFLRYSRHSL